jgi:hypothetical protein
MAIGRNSSTLPVESFERLFITSRVQPSGGPSATSVPGGIRSNSRGSQSTGPLARGRPVGPREGRAMGSQIQSAVAMARATATLVVKRAIRRPNNFPFLLKVAQQMGQAHRKAGKPASWGWGAIVRHVGE